ncbi:MAG TPA: TIGR02281 family clan AA aspartic protease [Candidatus Sulfotelmatobacter sp.]|nr:TIGR02281 family clan AA aspartic protease [Candidatus Sulfotelmatobacter sp.]
MGRERRGIGRHCALAILLVGILAGIGPGGRTAQAGAFEEGVGLFQLGHYQWALEKLLQAANQAPQNPQPLWYLAETYRQLGEDAAAAHEYRRILQVAPGSPVAADARRALATLGEPAQSRFQIPFQRAGKAMLVAGQVNGQALGVFILDTGATFLSVSRAAADGLGVQPTGGTVRLNTASGTITAPLVLLDEVDIGGAVAHHVPAVIHDLPSAPSSIIGLLGMSFLERFRVNLDLNAGILILESGE